MNLAIFGGSFDPPHIAHDQIVHNALEHLDIDKIIVVPTFLSPFKDKYHLEPQDRFELISTLFDKEDYVEVSDFELKQEFAVPSIVTVNHFKREYSPLKIYLIIGSDNLKSIHLWNNFEQLKELVEFVVISRDGYEVKNDIIRFIKLDMDINISSSTLRENFDLKYIPTKIQQKVKQLWNKE